MSINLFEYFAEKVAAIPYEGDILYPLFETMVKICKMPLSTSPPEAEGTANDSDDEWFSAEEAPEVDGDGEELEATLRYIREREEEGAAELISTRAREALIKEWFSTNPQLFVTIFYAVCVKLVRFHSKAFYYRCIAKYPVVNLRRKLREVRMLEEEENAPTDKEASEFPSVDIYVQNQKDLPQVAEQLVNYMVESYGTLYNSSFQFFAMEYMMHGGAFISSNPSLVRILVLQLEPYVRMVLRHPDGPRGGWTEYCISVEKQRDQFLQRMAQHEYRLENVLFKEKKKGEEKGEGNDEEEYESGVFSSEEPNDSNNDEVVEKAEEAQPDDDNKEEVEEVEEPSQETLEAARDSLIEQLMEYSQSKTPLSTSLFRDVCVVRESHIHSLQERGQSTAATPSATHVLFPTVYPEDRDTFLGGHVRVSPYCSEAEVRYMLGWLGVPTEDDINDPNYFVNLKAVLGDPSEPLSAEEHQILLNGCCEVHLPPDDDPLKEVLTIAVEDLCLRLSLTNPLLVETITGYQCDCCCRGEVDIAFQAVVYSDIRNKQQLFIKGCGGFDVCLGCVVYLFKSSVVRIAGAAHPTARLRRPFLSLDSRRPQMWIWSLTVTEAEAKGERWVVEAVVGLAMYTTLPLMWTVPAATLADLEQVWDGNALRHAEAPSYVEVTPSLMAALPTPPADWRTHCLVQQTGSMDSESGGRGYECDDREKCAICLGDLGDDTQVPLRTLCGHWFHAGCIENIRSTGHTTADEAAAPEAGEEEVERGEGCPLCRRKDYLPKAHAIESFTKDNLYRLRLQVEAPKDGSPVEVAVGVLLSRDGVYHNPSNIGAMEVFSVSPGYLYSSEWNTSQSSAESA